MQFLAAPSTGRQLRSISQNNQAFSLEQRFELPDPVEADDDGTVDSKKLLRRQPSFDHADASTQQITLLSDVQLEVIACGLNPIDFADLHKSETTSRFHSQP